MAESIRGNGSGKSLMQRSIESAREMGYSKLYLESLPHFSRAIGMCDRLGFDRLAAPLGQSGHTGCSIWMLKEL